MVCKKCGQEFGGNFCPNCGAPAAHVPPPAAPERELCPSCGTPMENGVCPLCGQVRDQQPARPNDLPSAAASFRVRKWMPWLALPLIFVSFFLAMGSTNSAAIPDPVKTTLDFFYLCLGIAVCTWLFRKARAPEKRDTRQQWIILAFIGLCLLAGVAAACIWGEVGAIVGILLMVCTPLIYTVLRKYFDPSYGEVSPSPSQNFFVKKWNAFRQKESAKKTLAQIEKKRITYNKRHGITMCPKCKSEDLLALEPITVSGGFWDGGVFYERNEQTMDTRWACRTCGHCWNE